MKNSAQPHNKHLIAEQYHHYFKHDEDSDGGKSMAFLRLGRSTEDAQDKDEIIRKEIDEALKSTVSNKKHNIAKRSNVPQDLDDGLIHDVPTITDDQNNGESEQSEVLGRFANSSPYDPTEVQNEEDLHEKENIEFIPYEGSDSAEEEEDGDLLDMKALFPYSSSLAEFFNKRNSFSLRPMKRNNFAFRPMKKNNFAFRPMKKNNFAFRPMKRNNFAFRPMKKNNFAFRPMKKNNFAFRPMKKNNFAFRPMKKNGDSFTFRPFKKSGNHFAFRPMKRGTQFSKDSFLRYGKRDSFALRPMKRSSTFALRPMKRPEDSFVLRPMKKGSFSLRPMKKDTIGFQLRPMKRNYDDHEVLRQEAPWQEGAPIDPTQHFEDYNGIEAFVKRDGIRYIPSPLK